jgi:hypothetical protein
MHARGSLVPIAGTVSVHRAGGSGEPTHFVLRASVGPTAGARSYVWRAAPTGHVTPVPPSPQ